MKNISSRKKIFFTLGLLFLLLVPSFNGVVYAQAAACTGSNFIVNGVCNVIATLALVPMQLGAFILTLAGMFLNVVLHYTVTDLATTINNITAINIAWSVIRDLANITFIFILLYMAIGTILGIESINWKKTIRNVIIAAILINFSLFFTKIIIDGSNIVAAFFYERIDPDIGSTLNQGLSNSYMQPLGLPSLYSVSNGTNLLTSLGGSFGSIFVVSIGGFIFFLITAFVFFAASIMFIVRFVVFIFLLIFSPVMVLGSALPKIGDISRKWWKTLIDNAIFAPLFMIITYVILVVINDPGFIGLRQSGATFSEVLGDGVTEPSAIGLILNFIIIIAFAIGSLIIAKQFSTHGGSAGEKFAGKVFGGGMGAAGWAGRKTFGSVGRSIADSEKLKELAANEGGKYSRLTQMSAKAGMRSGQRLSSASFDARNVAKSGFKAMGLKGADFGKAQKGGYDKDIENEIKKETEFAKSLERSDLAKQSDQYAFNKVMAYGTDEEKDKARRRMDEIKGISPKEAKERKKALEAERDQKKSEHAAVAAVKAQKEEVARREKELEETKLEEVKKQRREELEQQKQILVEKEREAREAQEAIDATYKTRIETEAKEQAGLDERRKKAYADSISADRVISTNNTAFVGRVKRANKQAAIKIKKGDKSNAEKIAELAKKMAEEDKTPETPPADADASATT